MLFALWFYCISLGLIVETIANSAASTRTRAANIGYGVLSAAVSLLMLTIWRETAKKLGIHQIPCLFDLSHTTNTAGIASLAITWAMLNDLCYYGWHTAQHRYPILWRIHRLHHEQPRIDVTTRIRHHMLEDSAHLAFIMIPSVLLLRVPDISLLLAMVAVSFITFFSHIDARIGFGPLTPIIVGPAVHHIHHSRDRVLSRRNLAAVFPLLDIVFGTWTHPENKTGKLRRKNQQYSPG